MFRKFQEKTIYAPFDFLTHLFQHSQRCDATDPELYPEQVPPVEGAEDQPQQPHGHVDAAHHPVEGQQGPVNHGQVAVAS